MNNLLEYHSQEYYKHENYVGKQQVMSKGREILSRPQIAALEANKDDKKDSHRNAMEALAVHDYHMRGSWMPDLAGIASRMYPNLQPQAQGYYDKLIEGGYDSVLKNELKAEEQYEVQKQIMREVYKFDPEEEEEQEQKSQKDKGNGEGEGEGEGENSSEGGPDGEEKEGDGEGESKARTKQAKVKYDDLLMHDHEDSHSGASFTSLDIDYRDRKSVV